MVLLRSAADRVMRLPPVSPAGNECFAGSTRLVMSRREVKVSGIEDHCN
jgi:hypothetical protein